MGDIVAGMVFAMIIAAPWLCLAIGYWLDLRRYPD
jgi:hypothetical protein